MRWTKGPDSADWQVGAASREHAVPTPGDQPGRMPGGEPARASGG
jgi:hypothetical protein